MVCFSVRLFNWHNCKEKCLLSYLVDFGQTLEYAEHEAGAAGGVPGQPHAQGVQEHRVQGIGEQRLGKLSKEVLKDTCKPDKQKNINIYQLLCKTIWLF